MTGKKSFFNRIYWKNKYPLESPALFLRIKDSDSEDELLYVLKVKCISKLQDRWIRLRLQRNALIWNLKHKNQVPLASLTDPFPTYKHIDFHLFFKNHFENVSLYIILKAIAQVFKTEPVGFKNVMV